MKNLNTILPFYDAITEQYRYRADCDVEPCLTVSDTGLIPFLFRRTASAGTTATITIKFYDLNGVEKDSKAGSTYLTILNSGSYDYVYYNNTAFSPALTTGSRYMVITDTTPNPDKAWYSETFIVQNNLSTFLKLEFTANETLSNIMAKFTQVVYLNTVLKTPEYLREDTGDKRDGLLVKEKMVTMKSYMLRSILATEYLIDALMLVPLMDTVYITTQSGEVMTFNEIRIKDPEWQAEALGSRAKLEIQCIKDVVVKKLSFRETTYTSSGGGTMSAVIKTGGPVLTVASGRFFEYQVVFVDDMPVTTYKPDAVATATDATGNVQIAKCLNMTIHGFTIQTPVECEVRWSATYNLG